MASVEDVKFIKVAFDYFYDDAQIYEEMLVNDLLKLGYRVFYTDFNTAILTDASKDVLIDLLNDYTLRKYDKAMAFVKDCVEFED